MQITNNAYAVALITAIPIMISSRLPIGISKKKKLSVAFAANAKKIDALMCIPQASLIGPTSLLPRVAKYIFSIA